MKPPFERFKVSPTGFGCGRILVRVWPRMGFWEQFWNIFQGDIPSYYPTNQQEFIEEAIREKLEREAA